MTSYLLQENGGRFRLENGSGYLLLEQSTPDGGDQHGAGHVTELDVLRAVMRNDDELAALISTLL